MAWYRVPVTTAAETVVVVETDATDPYEIAELATEQVDIDDLCHQCANDVTLGDDWRAVLVDGTPTMTRLDEG
ncbi:hypothetical protein ACGRHY_28075 [Streptomyces sp. HK10]|uniref:hypothetical protein n=1 Tax=Streptomyces sp. HK10 TaxID=3373255 RepID=UPI0037488E79